MKHDKQLELIDLLHAQIDKGESQMFDSLTRIPVETYFSESKLSDEIDSLFNGIDNSCSL